MAEEDYKSNDFYKLLFKLHLASLIFLLFAKWLKSTEQFKGVKEFVLGVLEETRVWPIDIYEVKKLNPYNTLLILYSCNIVGIIFSPGSHRQFFAWYYYCLPLLLNILPKFPLFF